MMHPILVIDIRGDVDEAGLKRLRTHLDLKKRGRLTDDWDQEFGYRLVHPEGAERVKVGLYRDFDRSWKLHVSGSASEIDSTELALLRGELLSGITAAGFQATVRAKPTYGTTNQ